jgi:hypothetical protein
VPYKNFPTNLSTIFSKKFIETSNYSYSFLPVNYLSAGLQPFIFPVLTGCSIFGDNFLLMNQETNPALKRLLIVYICFCIFQSLIWFLNTYLVIPWQTNGGHMALSDYAKIQGVVSSVLQFIHIVFIVIFIITIKQPTIRMLLIIYVSVNLLWLVWPAIVMIKEIVGTKL